jgi:hypothetical protein
MMLKTSSSSRPRGGKPLLALLQAGLGSRIEKHCEQHEYRGEQRGAARGNHRGHIRGRRCREPRLKQGFFFCLHEPHLVTHGIHEAVAFELNPHNLFA